MADILVEDRFLAAIDNPGQWQNVRIADAFSTSDLEEIRRVLAKARAILEAFDGILDAVGAFTAILRALESFINDVLLAALLALTDAIEDAVNDFKSTGVYALDLITPFLKTDGSLVGDTCDDAVLTNPFNPADNSLAELNREAHKFFKFQTYEEFIEVIVDAFLDENDLPSPYITQNLLKKLNPRTNEIINASTDTTEKIISAKQDTVLNTVFRPGRPNFGPSGKLKFYLLTISTQNFTDFLRILTSFSRFFYNILGNHNAIIEFAQRSEAYAYCLTRRFTAESVGIIEQREVAYKQEIAEVQNELLGYDDIFNAFPNVVDVSRQSANNYSAFKAIYSSESFQNILNDTTREIGTLTLVYQGLINNIADGIENNNLANIQSSRRELENVIAQVTELKTKEQTNRNLLAQLTTEKNRISDQVVAAKKKDNPFIQEICGDGFINDPEVFKRKRFTADRSSSSIDFYGMSAYQLFPDLFERIEDLLRLIRSYAKPIRTTVADLLDNLIKAIRQEIENLKQIISVIEQILQFIEDFLNLNGISMLALDSSSGTYGLINQLRNAQGFVGQNTGKQLFIAGIMVGVGYPSLDEETGVFGNVNAVFELEKQNISGGRTNLEAITNASINNADSAIAKFAQFFQ